jgi:hypothetical protein
MQVATLPKSLLSYKVCLPWESYFSYEKEVVFLILILEPHE